MKTHHSAGPNTLRIPWFFFIAALFVLSGCATPVGVRHLDLKEANRKLTESVLSEDQLSAPTLQILNRSGLAKKFQSEPVFALAELSFLYATKSDDRPYFLSAAVYAYAFLFPKDAGSIPDPFDPRLRTAANIYNQGIAEGFTNKESKEVLLEAGTYKLPFGELIVRLDPNELLWGPFRMENFVAALSWESETRPGRTGSGLHANPPCIEDCSHCLPTPGRR